MKKIAIIGTAPLSRDMTPYDDMSWDIWGCSPGNQNMLKRVSVWFELHSIVEMEGAENKAWFDPYMAWLRAQTFPVYMQEPNEHIPQSKVFPYKALIKQFDTRDFFTSSIAWMLAFAITKKPDEIAIFGVDMAADQEHYTGQRAGCRYWIEVAKRAGIKVTIPWESCLGQPTPLYCYWESTPLGRRLNVSEAQVVQRHAQINAAIENGRLEKSFFEGALEQLRYIKRTFVDGADAVLDADEAMLNHLTDAAKAFVAKEGIAVKESVTNLRPPPVVSLTSGNNTPSPAKRGRKTGNGVAQPKSAVVPFTELAKGA